MNIFSRIRHLFALDAVDIGKEKTGQQIPQSQRVTVASSEDNLTTPEAKSIATWRKMRMHPTISLARAIFTAPIRMMKFSVGAEEVDENVVALVQEQFDDIWFDLTNNIIFAFDYGWQAFELVYGFNEKNEVIIDKLKPLIPDTTFVVLKERTGEYNGLLNGARRSFGATSAPTGGTYLPPEYSWWFTHQQEGANWYGESIMERARDDYNKWREASARGDRYLTSVAGPIPMVQYPVGEITDQNGTQVRTLEMAQQIIQGLSKCKGVAMPNVVTAWADQLMNAGADPSRIEAWKLSFVESSGQHGQEFLSQEHAREVAMMRAWMVPERAAMEGQFGTKAEAETHGEHVLNEAAAQATEIVHSLNKYLVNRIVKINFGESMVGRVWIEREEIDTSKKQLLQELIRGAFGAPVNADILTDLLDVEAAFELLGLPRAQNVADAISNIQSLPDTADKSISVPVPGNATTADRREGNNAPDDYLDRNQDGSLVADTSSILRDVANGTISPAGGVRMLTALCHVDSQLANDLVNSINLERDTINDDDDDEPKENELRYVDLGDKKRWFKFVNGSWIETDVAEEIK